jgi:putative transposase
MARSSRLVLADWPHHIIQRGHNRQPVFRSPDDFRAYLANLEEWKRTLGCRVYAYCLMTNHLHLVIDPGPKATNLALLMKRVAGRYTRRINHQTGRTGTLWEGRYKSSPIETDTYLLACCRYIELNPVRANLVERPENYPWSSYRAHTGLDAVPWLDEDPCYAGLGPTLAERRARYAQWVADAIPAGEWPTIRQAIHRGQLTGSPKFIADISIRMGRRLESRGRGRPRQTGK